MTFSLKLLISNIVIISCVLLGKKLPSLAGLIAAMPLTTLIVLAWLFGDSNGNRQVLTSFVGGVMWGVVPTLLFFAVLLICLKRGVPFGAALAVAGCVWLGGAGVHQYLLK